MRKVLLASTALFALGSVSAMAADISISGSSEVVLDMGDSATADDSGLAIEHDIAISFSNTSDSGITTSTTNVLLEVVHHPLEVAHHPQEAVV